MLRQQQRRAVTAMVRLAMASTSSPHGITATNLLVSARSALSYSRPLLSLSAAAPTAPATQRPQPLSSTSSSSQVLPVAPELLEELRLVVARAPSDTWCPVSDVYCELPLAMRRQHVRPHKTMLCVLEKAKGHLGIVLSSSGVFFAKGTPPAESAGAGPPDQPSADGAEGAREKSLGSSGVVPCPGEPHSDGRPSTENDDGKDDGSGAFYRPLRTSPPSPRVLKVFGSDVPPPVDFYYDVGLAEFPPPPMDFDVTPSALAPAQGSEDGSVLSVSDFVNYIPPFFVPLEEVLKGMPGYTEAHMDSYLATSKAMEIVRIAGAKYVRLYGGYAKIRLDGCEVAEEAFARYKPDRSLVPAFREAFSGITDQWMPLKMLLSRVDAKVVAALPFQGPAAITYFAQMQDVFAFSGNSDGVTSSVLLRKPGFGGLEAETTPSPKTFNHLLHMTPSEGSVDVQSILADLPAGIQDEIALYYGDIFAFFNAHAPVFFLSEDHSVVMRTSYKRRLHEASLPLEEQLQIALERRDKLRARTLRRRIAFRDNPAHPFHDPDNLAQQIAKYLPRKGFVTLKTFMKKHVPEDVLFFMPKKTHNFFDNYPQYFQQFEYQQAGMWAISRPGQPLPRGVIRKDFTEDDVVALTAEFLQRKGSRSCTTIYLHLPRGAQDVVRKRHGGVYYFVKRYPQYFNVVLGSDTENRRSSAVVHLVRVPVQHLDEANHEHTTSSVQDVSDADEVEH